MRLGQYGFELAFSVRDYECDLQGLVNNAVYLNYLEHTRHEFLKNIGFDFAELHRSGFDLVMTRCELEYRSPLRSGDHFAVGLNMVRESRLRFSFYQDLFRHNREELLLCAKIVATCLNEKGQPAFPDGLADRLASHASGAPQER